ncbi:TetR/AcrR family transcriptional regulator [Kordiimonas lipolytica]|uniref:TetR/AcrR family transcriptional regulator n=1 Tax=Kordiimonas lipolytica TaxID=1662421 RepID=A0ABV8UD00_9PROT
MGPVTEQKQSKRDLILELAEQSVLEKGFAATSIDELIAAAGITKSGFFYHFKDKAELAKHMYLRYLERDNKAFADLFEAADAATDDPLEQFLHMIDGLTDMLRDLPKTHPGCLIASCTYQYQLFNKEIHDLNKQGILEWRDLFRDRLEAIAEKYPPKGEVDMDVMADLLTTLIEGGIVVSRSLGEKSVLPQQVALYRDYLERVFRPND